MSVSSAISTDLQVVLVEDNTGQELARIEGPGLFRMSSTEEYRILIREAQGNQQDSLWVRIVIASGLVAAKQQRKRWGKSDSRVTNVDYVAGDVRFVD